MSARKYFNSDSESGDSGEEESILFPKKKEKRVEPESEEEEQLLADSDSDSAPDDVAFTESRKTMLDKVKRTLAQINTTKQEQKAKRKEKDALYKQQKLESLNKNRLSEDFLNDLDDDPSPPKKSKTVKQAQGADKSVDSETEEVADEIIPSGDGSESDDGFNSDEDFIPLTKPEAGPEAVCLPGYVRDKPKSMIEQARQFRDRALFNVKVPRAPAQDLLSKKQKRAARRQ